MHIFILNTFISHTCAHLSAIPGLGCPLRTEYKIQQFMGKKFSPTSLYRNHPKKLDSSSLKPSLSADDMVLYIENPKDANRKLLVPSMNSVKL